MLHHTFFHFFVHYKYSVLFLGLFFNGDTAILAGIYLSLIGVMKLWYVMVLAVVAALLGDAVWYWVGMLISYDRIKKLPYFRTRQEKINSLEKFLDKHALRALFYSKFVYGTRMPVQLLCGTHRVNIWKYFAVNTLGTAIWILFLVLIGKAVDINLHTFKNIAHGFEITLLVLVILVVVVHSIMKRFMMKNISTEN